MAVSVEFNPSFTFCDFDKADQDDFETYFIWALEDLLHENGFDGAEVRVGNSAVATPLIYGVSSPEERVRVSKLITQAEGQIRDEVEAGIL